MNIFTVLADKLKQRRLWLTNNFSYGCFYHGSYQRWKTDPNPLIFIMYSDRNYTQGLNIHHMSYADKEWFKSLVASFAFNHTKIDGYSLYQMLKQRRYTIVQTAYRKYFTNMLNLKMVSGGINPELNNFNHSISDSYIISLNNIIEGKENLNGYYKPTPEQIQTRIAMANNIIDLGRKNNPMAGRTAPWYRGQATNI